MDKEVPFYVNVLVQGKKKKKTFHQRKYLTVGNGL